MNESLDNTSTTLSEFTDSELIFKRTREEKEHAQAIVTNLLTEPLGQPEAIQLALANSASFQAVLARNWANSVQAAQSGRLPNPMLGLENLKVGSETEITQLLSFGLLDILTLPWRQQVAKSKLQMAQLKLTSDVIEHITNVRQAWVLAIAAEQKHEYAKQVFESAEASAELAEKMQDVGNFSRLDRARQQSFYTDAATQLSTAAHNALAAKEALIRFLGLNEVQVSQLQLPERLPQLPDEPRSPETIGSFATKDRLDIQLANASMSAAARAQGMGGIYSYTDIELGVIRQSIKEDGDRTNGKGYEIDIRLPLFDWGDLQRASMNARTLAAANTLEATLHEAASALRETYSAYRTAYDVSAFYRDEVLPLQEVIAEENVLRYNGMLIGVFELLADSRRQVAIVVDAIDAEAQFWMADAAMQATLIGKPTMAVVAAGSDMADAGGGH
jgi:outer membrane protein TolC